MRSMRRIRNVAFLGLLVTLIWAGSANLSADSGGFFCGYGDCVLTYYDCYGAWTPGSCGEPGCCSWMYTPAMQGGGEVCYINYESSGMFQWHYEPCGENHCFVCYQI